MKGKFIIFRSMPSTHVILREAEGEDAESNKNEDNPL